MAMHFFSIPAINGHQEQEAFNRFCAGQAVVAVEHHLARISHQMDESSLVL